jgi:hypothetical protein
MVVRLDKPVLPDESEIVEAQKAFGVLGSQKSNQRCFSVLPPSR